MSREENIRIIQQEADDLWAKDAILVPEFNTDFTKPSQEDWDTSRLADEDRGAVGLRKFLANPDKESLRAVYGTAGAEKITQQLDAEEVEATCKAWIESRPQIEREGHEGQHNIDEIVARVKGNHPGEDGDGVWTEETLDEAYRELVSEGALYPAKGYSKPLSQADLLRVARLAGQGKLGEAAVVYIQAALPSWGGAVDVTCIPEYSGLLNECCWYVFKHAPGYEDFKGTPEQVAYLEEYVAGRPVTISLLQAGWKSYVREQREGRIAAMLPSENTVPNFDKMSDAEIERALQSVNRHLNGRKVGQ